jgi:hypothetical protein
MFSLRYTNKIKNKIIIGFLKHTLYGDILKTENKTVFISMDCVLYKQKGTKLKNSIVMRRLGHTLFSNGHMVFADGKHQSGCNDLVRWTQTFFLKKKNKKNSY